MKVTGHLTKLLVKNGVSKQGKAWTSYSLGIDSDGSGKVTWYGHGFKKPDVTEGQTVSFEGGEDDRGYMQVQGPIEVLKTKSVAAKAVAAGQDARSDSIVRQNASSTAARIARDLVELGIVPLPTKKDAKYDFYMELLEEVTNRLFVSNREAPSVEMLRESGAVEETDEEDDIPPPGPDDDDDDYSVV